MKGWVDYWRTVRDRVVFDRGFARAVWVVAWLGVKGRIRRPPATGRIAYHPQPAGPWYTLPLALRHTGLRRTRDLAKADLVMVFDDRTRSDVALPELDVPCLNARATDISKAEVARVFESVFGYPLSLDPTIHKGPMVEKSDINGVHDGRIVDGPLPAGRKGYAYQKLVDSTVRPCVSEDLRCVCVGGAVAQVFRKEKAYAARFAARYLETILRDGGEVFSDRERTLIAAFCQAIGLDFGSIDVLRDHAGDGRIYIVDVNKTCMPVLSMPVEALDEGLRTIGQAFEARYG